MIRKSVHQQASYLRILALCLAALLLSGSGVIAGSEGSQVTVATAASSSGAVDTQQPTVHKASPGSRQAGAPQVSSTVAARFLEQASWGPTAATIAQVQQGTLQDYLQTQFTAPISTYVTPSSTQKLNFVQNQFFVNALQGQDQLRQRVSFALSEIIVISGVGTNIKSPTAFSLWMNMMQNDAFGNFFSLLNDVTLSPGMGSYLNMARNNGCAKNCRPNENYAREVLQLFTIGLYELNNDGTPMLDQNGDLIPTYGQDTIDGFGQLFTGWSYPPLPGQPPQFFGKTNYGGPMIAFPKHYSKASKLLLNGVTIPANGDIQADLTSGLQNIFTHPNVGPFISQQLIEKLVTSNPSPAYVSRVAAVFNNDGTGVRGNLQAVVSAILLDSEARRGDDPTQVLPSDGHLREPLLHMLATLRAVNATTGGTNLNNYGSGMAQSPFLSPSVFNFYPPNYEVQGTSLIGPEFKILNANTTMARINFVNDLIYGSVGPDTTTDISQYVNVAGNVTSLLNLVNTNMMHGAMPSDMYNTLSTTLSSSAFTTPTSVAQAALYLVATSSQYQVEH
jgi:uncharacterized protein (DUF1800 family)